MEGGIQAQRPARRRCSGMPRSCAWSLPVLGFSGGTVRDSVGASVICACAPCFSPVMLLCRGCQGSGPIRISAAVNGHGRGPAVLTDASDIKAV